MESALNNHADSEQIEDGDVGQLPIISPRYRPADRLRYGEESTVLQKLGKNHIYNFFANIVCGH